MPRAPDDQLQLPVVRDEQRQQSRRIMRRLRADADRIAGEFGLSYKRILPERHAVTEHYGVCYANGEIRIRLRHAATGKPLRYSSLMDTVCHELAHLRHFDHGERFQAFFEEMLEWARAEGIYRPAKQKPRKALKEQAPEPMGGQLPLFGGQRLREIVGRRRES